MGYVGQTVMRPDRRYHQHLNAARRGSKLAVHRWLAGILETGREPSLTIFGTAPSKQEANHLEQCGMRWARKGLRLVLLNRRRAGNGVYDGAALSEATRLGLKDPAIRARSRANIQRLRDDPEIEARRLAGIRAAAARPEVRAKLVAQAKRMTDDPEIFARRVAGIRAANHRPAQSKSMKEVWARAGYRERSSLSMREAAARPDVRAKNSARAKASNARPEVKAIISRTSKERWQSQSHRQLVASKSAETNATPETKARRSSASASRWADPEYRERVLAKMAEVRSTPEWQEKMREGHRKRWADFKTASSGKVGVSHCGQ